MLIKESIENPVRRALGAGQSIWYDGLISADTFRRMIEEDGLRGATTNPAIFEKELAGSRYDAEIKILAGTHSAEEIYKTFAVRAVRDIAGELLIISQFTLYARTRKGTKKTVAGRGRRRGAKKK